MFDSPILDLIILLSFTYFIGSLILSSINEAIAGTLRLRQKHLRYVLEGLLFDSAWPVFVKDRLLKSPHIQSLMRRSERYPAYIPALNFVLAVIENLGSADFTQGKLRSSISSSSLPAQFKQVLLDLEAQAEGNLEKFQKNLEAFYNNSMDRATGWYKKRIRLILFVLACLLSIVLNLDTIKITNDALSDKEALQEAAQKISALLPSITTSKDSSLTTVVSIRDKGGEKIVIQRVTLNADTSFVITNETFIQKGKEFKSMVLLMKENSSYNFGYTDLYDFQQQWWGHNNSTSHWSKLL